MNLHVSSGNTKLGNIFNLNLPPVISCKKGVPCAKEHKCYALKAFRQYPNVRTAWNENLNLYKEDPDDYFNQLKNFLFRRRNKDIRFRYHSSGDILDQNYFEKMKEIAGIFPTIKFLAFTKNDNIDFSGELPENLIIRFSYWPNYDNHSELTHFAWLIIFFNQGK